jgi:hypothetical protein
MNDPTTLNLVISLASLLIGGVIGFFINRYFYLKNKPDQDAILYSLHQAELARIKSKYIELFDSPKSYVRDYLNIAPTNPDIPHLEELRCVSNIASRGNKLLILFSVIDEGMNFSLKKGIVLTDVTTGIDIPVVLEGRGLYSCKIEIPKSAHIGTHEVVFTLTDLGGKASKQTFTYMVK